MDRKISFFYFKGFGHMDHLESPLDRGDFLGIVLLKYLVDGVVARNYKVSVQ